MRREQLGSVTFQTQEAFKELITFGQSKHSAKTEFLKNYDGNKAIDKFMSSFAKQSGIYSFETLKDYLPVAVDASKFAQKNFGVKDISNINSEMINSFLESKINKNVAKATIQKYVSALEKFSTALEKKFEQKYDFEIKTGLLQEKEKLAVKGRSGYYCYENSDILLKNINENKNIKESHKIAFSIALETGARFHKTMTVSGVKQDENGFFYTNGKGGRIERFEGLNSLSLKTADRLKTYLKDENKETFKLSDKDYKAVLREVEKAAKATNQHYEGLHGLKKSFAKNVREELINQRGMSYKDAINSKEYQHSLAHNRHLSTYERG